MIVFESDLKPKQKTFVNWNVFKTIYNPNYTLEYKLFIILKLQELLYETVCDLIKVF